MADESNPPQRILLVTGLSGAGKTTALQVLEDLGWETIDNFPIRLLGGFVAGEGGTPSSPWHAKSVTAQGRGNDLEAPQAGREAI